MKFSLPSFIILALILTACKDPAPKNLPLPAHADSTTTKKQPEPSLFDIMDELASHMKNKVRLDTFMTGLTRQENVVEIAKLNDVWNDTTKSYIYSNDNYHFELTADENGSATFKDGNTKIHFKDLTLTCMPDTIFQCEDYGFNDRNSLEKPRIIEVAGKKFLYSDVSYWCNGIGCGCVITFIYDLQKKKATVIENYRIPFDGFFLSDFNNDNNPDLLVISKNDLGQMKGFRFDEFELRLNWFYYDNGKFKPRINHRMQQLYYYDLYSFVPDYHHSSHENLVYSITQDHWTQ